MLQATNIARELDDHGLHAETNAEVRNLVFPGVPYGRDHSFHAALAESARDQNAVEPLQILDALRPAQVFRFDPMDVDLDAMREPASESLEIKG